MRDVAERAGVHPSTVSLCLKNSPSIPLKTRERVKAIALELHYRPHPFVQSLMRSRRMRVRTETSPVIAFVTFFPTRDGWKKRSILGIESTLPKCREQASNRGFEVREFWGPLNKYTPARLSEILYNRGIKGVIFTPGPCPLDTMDWDYSKFACVALGTSLRQPGLHRVRSNLFEMTMTALSECHRLGYRRPGLAIDEDYNRRTESRWLAGWLLMKRQLNLINPPEPLLTDSWTRETFLAWIRKNRPDVVLTLKADEIIQWLEADGFRVPQDIGVLSISAESGGRHSGICEDWEMQGVRAANLVVDLLSANSLGLSSSPITTLVDGKWNPGETMRPQ